MRKRVSITKGYVWLLVILVAIVLISSFSIYQFNKQAYEVILEKQEESMDNISEFITKSYKRKIKDMFEILNSATVILRNDIENGQGKDVIIEEIKEIQSRNQFVRMGIVYPNGVGYTIDGKEIELGDRDFFQASIKGEKYISNLINIELSSEKLLLFSVPIEKDGQILGVLYGWYDSDQLMEEMDFDKDSPIYFLVLDSNGDYISKAQNKNVLVKDETNFWVALKNNYYVDEDELQEIQSNMKNGKNGNFEFQNEMDTRYVNYEPLGVNEWYIVSLLVDKDVTSSTALFYSLAMKLLIKILFGFFLLGAFLYLYQKYSNRIIREKNEQLASQNHILNLTLENTKDIPFELNVKEKTIVFFKNSLYKSQGEYKSFQADVDELIRVGFLAEDSREEGRMFLEQVFSNQKGVEQVICVYFDGKERWVKVKMIDSYADNEKNLKIGVIMDFMEQKSQENRLQRKEMEMKQLEKESSFDFLTKVWNRKKLEEEIDCYLKKITEDELQAFLIIDLDHFKEVNDTLGHSMGDFVLQDVANKLRNHVRDYDFIGRLGGDEFVVFAKKIRTKENIEKIAVSLNHILEKVYEKDGQQVKISASIGIAFCPNEGRSFKDLYKKADIALYKTKENGKNGYTIYKDEIERMR